MTTLLEGPRTSTPTGGPDPDVVTLLPGRAALLDLLALRRPAAGRAVTGLVLVGLVDVRGPVGAGTLVAVADDLAGGLGPDEWLARCGPAEFAVVTDDVPEDAAARLLAVAGVPSSAGVSPVVPGRDAAEVLRLAGLGLAIARLGGPGHTVRYPA